MLIKKNISLFLGVFFILLVSFISFTWFEKDLVYSFGDFSFTFSPRSNFEQFIYIWNEKISTGTANLQNFPNLFPYQIFLYCWDYLQLPLPLGQHLMFWGLFLSSGLSMYCLILTICKDEKRHLWATFSGIFYMMNPFSLIVLWGVLNKPVFFYPFVPLLLALYIRLLKERKKQMFYLFLFVFFSLFTIPAFSVLTYVADLWLVILSYLFFYFVFGRETGGEKYKSLKLTVLLLFFWFSVNAFWFIPYQSRAEETVKSSYKQAVTSPLPILKGASRQAQLPNTFRLLGYNVFFENFMNTDPFYPYAETYRTPLFSFLSFLIPLIVFSSLYFIFKKDSLENKFSVLYFLVFSLLVLFFFKGINKPLGGIYLWLANISPFFALAFRNPVDKIGLLTAFGFSVLFGFFIMRLLLLLNNLLKSLLLFFVFFVVFVVYLFPFWKGLVFYKGGKIYRSSLVKVPDYYWEAAEWLKGQKDDFRIFSVPIMGMYGTPLKWEHGSDAGDPASIIFDKPIFFSVGEKDSLQLKIWWVLNGTNTITDKEINRLQYGMSLTRTKYFMIRDDIAENYFSVDREVFNRVKRNIERNLTLEKTIGKLRFYTLLGTNSLPGIFFLSQNQDIGWTNNLPIIKAKYSRINPTKWIIDAPDTGQPYYLIILNKYDPNWKVYLLPEREGNNIFSNFTETLFKEPLEEKKHRQIYDYANLWEIDLSNKNFSRIVVEYVPQRLFYLGSIISVVSFLILTILGLRNIKKCKQDKESEE